MKGKCPQNNEPPAPNDERGVITTGLILFVTSTALRQYGRSVAFCKGKAMMFSFMFLITSFHSEAFSPYTYRNSFLLFCGDTLVMDSYPLNDLPSAQKELSGRLGSRQKPDGSKSYSAVTQCWEIYDSHLFLVKADSELYTDAEEQATLEFVFGKYYRDGKVSAEWYSGSVYGLIGPVIWILPSVAPVFKKEKEFLLSEGKVIGILDHDNSKSKNSVYANKPQLLSDVVYSKINWNNISKSQGTYTRVFVKFFANEEGVVDDVQVLKGLDKQTNEEAIRIVKLIPDWFVIFRHGKLQRVPYVLPIDFGEETRRKYQK